MAFTVKDWKDRPSALDPMAGETLAQWEARATTYIAANPTLVTLLNAAAMEDLETRFAAYIDAQIAAFSGGSTSAPTNVGRPTISGTLTTGNVLTGDPGTWNGNPFPTFTYRWLRNGTLISGQTNPTYTLVTADENQNIVFEVTGSNGIGNAIVATSLPVVPTAVGAAWTPPAGASTPESKILIGPSATYTGAVIDMVTSGSTHTLDAQSTSDVAGTLSIEDSTDGDTGWATIGVTVASTTSGSKQVAGLRRTTTKRFARIKYANSTTGQLEFSMVRWIS